MDIGRLVRQVVNRALDEAEQRDDVTIASAVNTTGEQRVDIVQNGKRTTIRSPRRSEK